MTGLLPQVKLLWMLDELHRFGFEQMRFAAGHEAQHYRVHLYAARDECGDLNFPAVREFWCSEGPPSVPTRDPHLAQKWDELLRGPLKPQHLAGMFVLDFPEIARYGFGPDHEYREWFRRLRPYLQENNQPYTYTDWHHVEDGFIYLTSGSRRLPAAPLYACAT